MGEVMREPRLCSIIQECEKKFTEDENYNPITDLLRSVLLHYTPATLHRLAASGITVAIRQSASFVLEKMGHRQ